MCVCVCACMCHNVTSLCKRKEINVLRAWLEMWMSHHFTALMRVKIDVLKCFMLWTSFYVCYSVFCCQIWTSVCMYVCVCGGEREKKRETHFIKWVEQHLTLYLWLKFFISNLGHCGTVPAYTSSAVMVCHYSWLFIHSLMTYLLPHMIICQECKSLWRDNYCAPIHHPVSKPRLLSKDLEINVYCGTCKVI